MQIEIQIPKAVFYMQKGVSVALCSQIAGMSEKEFLVEVKDRK